MFKTYAHRKTRLDERFKNPTEGMYEFYIPIDCKLRTYKDHAERLWLCWGYLNNLKNGITTKRCGWSCELSKSFDEKKFMKEILSK